MLSPSPAIVTGVMTLLDERMPDGSRCFSRLPRPADWQSVRDRVLLLAGAELVNFIDGGPARRWLDFRYRGRRFLIRGYDDRLLLSVDDPQCSDLILFQIGRHFEQLGKKTSGQTV